MKWSIKLGRLWGIDVYMHLTFLVLVGFIGLAHWLASGSLAAVAGGLLFILGLFACVLLHEYGHALMARRFGIPTRDITLLPIGGVARLERMPDKPAQELWVALAGPAVNVVIAAALFAWLTLTGTWQPLSQLSATGGGILERLFVANLFLVGFNLLPAFPMDGGRVLRALLAMGMDYARATGIAAAIGKGMAVLFGFVGLFTNPLLLLIALFVWVGASQEAEAAKIKSSLSGVRVRDAMLTDFRSLSPEDSLATATGLLLSGSQQDFPVVDNRRVVGLLDHSTLFRALHEHGAGVPVRQVMRVDFALLEANELIEDALPQVAPGGSRAMPVLSNHRLVGLLTAENLGEFFLIRAAMAGRGPLPSRWPSVPPPLPPAMIPPVMANRPAS